jgi:hypothetical protein
MHSNRRLRVHVRWPRVRMIRGESGAGVPTEQIPGIRGSGVGPIIVLPGELSSAAKLQQIRHKGLIGQSLRGPFGDGPD